MLSYDDGNLHTPISTSGGRSFASTSAGQFTTTEYNIIEYSYSTATNRDAYKNGSNTNLYTDTENNTPTTNGNPLYIGNEAGVTGRNMDGNLTEVIMYNTVLNGGQRIIVLNYLSAKYNIALSSNDVYNGDGANGFDHHVVGVGKVNNSNASLSASTANSGGLGLVTTTGNMTNNDYVIVGTDAVAGSNSQIYTDTLGLTGPKSARWARTWYMDETGNVTANISFDFSDAGISTTTPAVAANYKLLRRTGTSGTWTVTSGASISGDVVSFSGIAISDGYYTLGTENAFISPLPVEMVDFGGQQLDGMIQINWTTVSENNNASFTVERSMDGTHYSDVTTVASQAPGGNSNYAIAYSATDAQPLEGTSYYRLRINATDGSVEYSEALVVSQDTEGVSVMTHYDDAASALVIKTTGMEAAGDIEVSLFAANGDAKGNYTLNTAAGEAHSISVFLSPGVYLCRVSSASGSAVARFLVQ